jgi:hypothetical protein
MNTASSVLRLYVDLNHWIGLSRARLGRPRSEAYARVLGRIQAGVARGDLVLPLSAAIWEEVSRINDPKQRVELALTMDRLSRWNTIAERGALLRRQLLESLAQWRSIDLTHLEGEVIWGRGHAFAFAVDDLGFRFPPEVREYLARDPMTTVERIEAIAGYGWTYIDRELDQPDRVDRALWESGEFAMMRGPADADLKRLRSDGYEPEAWSKMVEEITAREAALTEILKSEPGHKHNLDAIVAARLWVWELGDYLPWAAENLGFEPKALWADGPAVATEVLLRMPSMQVEFALRRANWANGDYTWTTNDIFDLAHLGVAVPYCDAVWTERHAASVLNRAGVPERLGTKVVSRPAEVIELLGE